MQHVVADIVQVEEQLSMLCDRRWELIDSLRALVGDNLEVRMGLEMASRGLSFQEFAETLEVMTTAARAHEGGGPSRAE